VRREQNVIELEKRMFGGEAVRRENIDPGENIERRITTPRRATRLSRIFASTVVWPILTGFVRPFNSPAVRLENENSGIGL